MNSCRDIWRDPATPRAGEGGGGGGNCAQDQSTWDQKP